MRDRLLLLIAALIAFGASLASTFHFDDYAIFADPVLTANSGWWEVWRPLQTRPLTYFTFWLNFQIGGQNPIGYHALNLALHLAAVLLLYDVLRRIIDPRAALLAAAIFAVHPLQAEAVNYVWARGTLLMTVLCLFSLRYWIARRYAIAVLSFALALLAKEECAAFPIFLALLDLAGRRLSRRAIYAIIGMLACALAAGFHVFYAIRHTPGAGAGSQAAVSSAQYWIASGPVIWRYLRLFALPWGFTVDPQISLAPLWLGILAWAAIAAVACLALRTPASFWIAAGFLLLLPSSSLFRAADLAADRRMYLPMVAFAAAAALLLARIPKPAAVAIVSALAILSLLRTQVWMTEKSLWTEAVGRAPNKIRPKLQLARASPSEALQLLDAAKKIAPNDPAVASELGKMWLSLGRPQDALPEFGRALALSPRDAEAFNNRGVALQALGQAYPARRDFEHALRLDPCLFDARYNLLAQGIHVPATASCRYTSEQQRLLSGAR